jgi:hypothetical protein
MVNLLTVDTNGNIIIKTVNPPDLTGILDTRVIIVDSIGNVSTVTFDNIYNKKILTIDANNNFDVIILTSPCGNSVNGRPIINGTCKCNTGWAGAQCDSCDDSNGYVWSQSDSMCVCKEGYYWDNGNNKCTICPKGYQCSGGFVDRIKCNSDSFATQGQKLCTACGQNYTQSTTGDSCVCKPGYEGTNCQCGYTDAGCKNKYYANSARTCKYSSTGGTINDKQAPDGTVFNGTWTCVNGPNGTGTRCGYGDPSTFFPVEIPNNCPIKNV